MASMPNPTRRVHATSTMSRVVVGGIDTHKDLHVVAVIDTAETVLGTHSFSTTRAGYRALVKWLRTFGEVTKIGVEGNRQLRSRDLPAPDRRRPRGVGGRPARAVGSPPQRQGR